MLSGPSELEDGQVLSFDVCIVGAGAAGIVLALELEAHGLNVGLFEGGGLTSPELADDHPFDGESIGREYSLLSTRLRYFGGTTNHWGGWCRPLDALDFKTRRSVPWSGWPIGRTDLDTDYRRACSYCEIDPPEFELDRLPASEVREADFQLLDRRFVSKTFRLSPPTKFGLRYLSRISESSQVRAFLESNLAEIEASEHKAKRLRFKAGEKTFFARARHFVLALGAIENARLLLASNGAHPRGLGNQHDLVGRFFADHFGSLIGSLVTTPSAPYRPQRVGDLRFVPTLSFSEEEIEGRGLRNFGLQFVSFRRRVDSLLDGRFFAASEIYPERRADEGGEMFRVLLKAEPTPNPESRVSLIDDLDPNGLRRVRLDWRVNSEDFESIETVTEVMGRRLGALNLGRLRKTYSRTTNARDFSYQSHQMGTTRMADDPKRGVVDRDCKVHSVENLYLAGSSVFPTFGFANPTLTLVALAIRLADHLKVRHRREA